MVLASQATQGEKFNLVFKTGGQDSFTGEIGGQDKASFTIPIKDQHLWDIDDPFLYEVTASISGGDKVESYFGQRKIGVVNFPGSDFKYVALNNKPIYLQLCLDHGGEQLLGLDQGHLNVAMRISFQEQLLLDRLRKDRESEILLRTSASRFSS